MTSFVLGYHGCDQRVGERIVSGESFKLSTNEYDWLGPGIYFWEANPLRGLDFAREANKKTHIQIAVCNPDCIKGVFRVPAGQLRSI